MKRALFGAAAGLLLSATAASAVTTVSLNGFCNSYNFRKSTEGYSVKDIGCSEGFGAGYLATVKGSGKTVIVALQDPSSTHTQFVFKFSYPFVTGGTWNLADTTDGVHFSTIAAGNYTLPAAAQRGMHGTKSVTSK